MIKFLISVYNELLLYIYRINKIEIIFVNFLFVNNEIFSLRDYRFLFNNIFYFINQKFK